jgi:hypothetical protein
MCSYVYSVEEGTITQQFKKKDISSIQKPKYNFLKFIIYIYIL